MARAGRRSGKAQGSDQKTRWMIGGAALLLALLAFYVLMTGGGSSTGTATPADRAREPAKGRTQDALDDIDAQSREAMRDLLRDAGD